MLRPIQNIFSSADYPCLLAGLDSPDDAAVWKLDDTKGLVITTDFFTPVVDDPYDYGEIAAANSLSDIYAMGGEPFLALNIAALPPQLPPEFVSEILRGGAEKAKQAGVVIAGGHTIQDKEPKYGLVAVGFLQLDQILSKGGLQPGDVLFLSKPLGIGVISSALKSALLQPEDIQEAVLWMKTLNKEAAKLARKFHAKAATDITGFSLLGHAWEMAAASQVGLRFAYDQIPFLAHAHTLAKNWCFPGGAFDNEDFFGSHVQFSESIPAENRTLLFDPQTSGGLLFGIPAENALLCQQAAQDNQIPLWKVGQVTTTGLIEVSEREPL